MGRGEGGDGGRHRSDRTDSLVGSEESRMQSLRVASCSVLVQPYDGAVLIQYD